MVGRIGLARVPAKWTPVRRQGHAPMHESRARPGTGRALVAVAAALIVAMAPARGAEVDAMITTAMKAAIDELAPPFERASGHTLRVVYGPSGGLARRLTGGETADLVIVESKVLDELIKQGRVAPGRTDLARTAIGIAVRKGAPKPDVSSADALRRALLAAKSIGHTAPAGAVWP